MYEACNVDVHPWSGTAVVGCSRSRVAYLISGRGQSKSWKGVPKVLKCKDIVFFLNHSEQRWEVTVEQLNMSNYLWCSCNSLRLTTSEICCRTYTAEINDVPQDQKTTIVAY